MKRYGYPVDIDHRVPNFQTSFPVYDGPLLQSSLSRKNFFDSSHSVKVEQDQLTSGLSFSTPSSGFSDDQVLWDFCNQLSPNDFESFVGDVGIYELLSSPNCNGQTFSGHTLTSSNSTEAGLASPQVLLSPSYFLSGLTKQFDFGRSRSIDFMMLDEIIRSDESKDDKPLALTNGGGLQVQKAEIDTPLTTILKEQSSPFFPELPQLSTLTIEQIISDLSQSSQSSSSIYAESELSNIPTPVYWMTANQRQATTATPSSSASPSPIGLHDTSSASSWSSRSNSPCPVDIGADESDINTVPMSEDGDSSIGRLHGKHTTHLWQFLKELLLQPQYYLSCIRWVDRNAGIFKIEDSAQVAKLWGKRKNRPAMNYDKLSRSIRQYYKKGIIKKTVQSKRLVYQFCPKYL